MSAVEDSPPPAAGPPFVAHRALVAPSSINSAARTVQVVWSTGARARNFVPPLGVIVEELDMAPEAVRMDQLSSGNAPVLDTHSRFGVRDVLGRVNSARIERGRGLATLQFSVASDVEPVWQRIVDGTLRGVSVGYRVHRYEQIADVATGETIFRAVDWEPYEISIVPLPVDRGTGMRGEAPQGAPALAVEPALIEKDLTMSQTTPDTPDAAAPSAPPAAAPAATRAGNDAARDNKPDADAAVRAERERVAALDAVAIASRALMPAERVDRVRAEAVSAGWTPEALRAALWDQFVKEAKPSIPARPEPGPSSDDRKQIIDAMAEAIAVRSMPDYKPGGSGRHTEYLGWRPSDMVGELLRIGGERNVPRSLPMLAERAFHTTSDFPLLLSAAANKMLLAAFRLATPSYRQIFMRRDFRDFKPHLHLRVGDFPTLLPLLESGEIQAGTLSESRETVLLRTFGRRLRVTRQMLVNDDLGAFTDFASMIGRRVADFENATAYDLLNTASGDGPTLQTGNLPVFSVNVARANKAAAGGTIDLTTLAAGRAAIMRQKSLDGLPISVGQTMRLLVGPDRELVARQHTTAIAANVTTNVNIWAGFIQVVVDPQIPGNRWYLFAEPPVTPVYVYGYLNGVDGPQVTTGPVQGMDGIEVSVLFDFGVGAIDWRGGWFNPGN